MKPFYRWELLIFLWFAYFLNQADRQIYNVLLKNIQGDLELSDIQSGWVVTAFMLTYGILVPLAGFLGDRIRRKSIVVGSILFWSVATVLTGWTTGLVGLILFRSLATGGGEAFYYPAANALISQYHTRTRATAMGIHQSSLYVGMIVSSVLSGWLAVHFGWRVAFGVFGTIGIGLALWMAWRLRNDWKDREEEGGMVAEKEASPGIFYTLWEIFTRPSILALWLGFAAFNFVGLAFYTWMPTFLQDEFGLNPIHAGFHATFSHLVAAVFGVLLGGWLSDRWAGRRQAIRMELEGVSLLLCAPCVYLLATAPSLGGCIAGMALFGWMRGIYDSNLFAALFDFIPPQIRASASGLMLSVAMIVSAFGPLLLAMLKQQTDFVTAMASLSWVALAGGGIILLGRFFFFQRDYVQESGALLKTQNE
ncbi:MAG: MFS transporter [Planctomycetia bacterium]|nr:MFS transporter [Planctomycetia bacterium]